MKPKPYRKHDAKAFRWSMKPSRRALFADKGNAANWHWTTVVTSSTDCPWMIAQFWCESCANRDGNAQLIDPMHHSLRIYVSKLIRTLITSIIYCIRLFFAYVSAQSTSCECLRSHMHECDLIIRTKDGAYYRWKRYRKNWCWTRNIGGSDTIFQPVAEVESYDHSSFRIFTRLELCIAAMVGSFVSWYMVRCEAKRAVGLKWIMLWWNKSKILCNHKPIKWQRQYELFT